MMNARWLDLLASVVGGAGIYWAKAENRVSEHPRIAIGLWALSVYLTWRIS